MKLQLVYPIIEGFSVEAERKCDDQEMKSIEEDAKPACKKLKPNI